MGLAQRFAKSSLQMEFALPALPLTKLQPRRTDLDQTRNGSQAATVGYELTLSGAQLLFAFAIILGATTLSFWAFVHCWLFAR
jgi:hypothetical protein